MNRVTSAKTLLTGKRAIRSLTKASVVDVGYDLQNEIMILPFSSSSSGNQPAAREGTAGHKNA